VRQRLAGLLEDISSSAVDIVGDLMLDEYVVGDFNRISPEAPEPIMDERERAYIPGGAANVAVNAKALGAEPRLHGVVGDDPEGRILLDRLAGSGIDCTGVTTVPGRPTTRKTRLIARGSQVYRIDRETCVPVESGLVKEFVGRIGDSPPDVPAVVSDYAKGVVTPDLVRGVIGTGKRTLIDPKTTDFGVYAGAFLVTPNFNEFFRAAGAGGMSVDRLESAGRAVMEQYGIKNLLVTHGAEGMFLMQENQPLVHIHARAREVFDVTGAGDTVIATVSCGVAAGASLEDACTVANIAAGIVVGKHRTATATPGEILDYAFGASSSEKIVDRETIAVRAAELKRAKRRIVFTNGCFDLLHMGHITYLNDARRLGDALVVGLNTDASVRRLKGGDRPIIPEQERSHVLAALECVDYVVPFDEDTPIELIKTVRPDVLVKGADYTVEEVVGHDVVQSWGGAVHLIPVVESLSTSAIIERIRKMR